MEFVRHGAGAGGAGRRQEVIRPTLTAEQELLAAGARLVAGIDEVGRGALAGPVSIGVVVVDAQTGAVPKGLADSKLISPGVRQALVEPIRSWCVHHAVGHSSAAEIDAIGIVAALRLAALRALSGLPEAPDAVILDGSHNWLTEEFDLFAEQPSVTTPPVHMRVKADQHCASVAAASVLAKVERDAHMTQLDSIVHGYQFASHKGYGSASHREAIRALGASDEHRRSWKLL